MSGLKKFYSGGTSLIGAMMIANFLNFVFNAWLGRVVTVEEFGLITLINTFYFLLGIGVNALGSTVNYRTAFLNSEQGVNKARAFFESTRAKSISVALFLSLIWISATPWLANFFQLPNYLSLVLITPLIFFGTWSSLNKGYLQGSFWFGLVAITLIIESLAKLGLALFIVPSIGDQWAYLSIPLSVGVAAIISSWLIKVYRPHVDAQGDPAFPRRYFSGAMIVGLSTSVFLTFDVILVKHFFSPAEAGQYSLLSLVGKMIFFLGSLGNGLVVSYVSREIGRNKNPNPIFYRFLLIAICLTIGAYLLIGWFGWITVPLLLGQRASAVLPYLNQYSLAISLLTIANVFTIYHLTRKHFSFTILAILSAGLLAGGFYVYHDSLQSVVRVISWVAIINLGLVMVLHLIKRNGEFILRNIVDMLSVLSPLETQSKGRAGAERILIFNWRDTKHKYAGGAEVYIHELAKRWVKMGHQVTVFCGNDGNSLRNETLDGVRVVRRGGFYFVYIWAFWYYLMKFRGQFDLIIDCQNGVPFFTPLYAKEKVYCLMFHVHQDVFMASLSKPLAMFAAVLENRLMPWAYRKTKFITISESTKQQMLDWDIGIAGVEIIHPGIDLDKYRPAEKNANPLIVYVGRLQSYKSVHIFLEAAKKILQHNPASEFVIAGDGEERPKLEQFAKKLKLTNQVKFLGKVSEEAKIALYQKAWVMVNPSMMEGWGITTIEANACGTPVVASDIPGLKDSVKNPHTGYLVKYGDSNKFAEKILEIISQHNLREKMEVYAIDWAKNFDWNISARKSLRYVL